MKNFKLQPLGLKDIVNELFKKDMFINEATLDKWIQKTYFETNENTGVIATVTGWMWNPFAYF